MAYSTFFSLLTMSALVFAIAAITSETEIATGAWNGVGVYMAVDAKNVQARLDEFAASSPGGTVPYHLFFFWVFIQKYYYYHYCFFTIIIIMCDLSTTPGWNPGELAFF